RELLYRIDGKGYAGDVLNTTLIDRGNIVPEVVVVRAVDLPVDQVSAGAVHRSIAAGGVTGKARRETDHLCEVTAIQRNVLHCLAWDRGCLYRRRGVERQAGAADFNRRGLLGDSEFYRYGMNGACRDSHLDDLESVEARGGHRNGV